MEVVSGSNEGEHVVITNLEARKRRNNLEEERLKYRKDHGMLATQQ
jgi:hypothetical protein